ncbi:hypothetical protein ALC57_06248 [Trachymyrmex cornetzi]|uniref:Uncharacterized protein n=1 Tax=Trachymyrmex cornetzi TaxID=471704 RepID=A0A195E7Y7_9HYME|nr:hypothetical protein ALC57_06248 [Trachymyrmex cornetzi]
MNCKLSDLLGSRGTDTRHISRLHKCRYRSTTRGSPCLLHLQTSLSEDLCRYQNDFDYGNPILPDDPSVSRNPPDARNHRDYSPFHLRSLRQSPPLLLPPRRSHLSLRLPLLPPLHPHPLDFDSPLSSTTSSSCDSESDSVLVVSFSLSDDKSRARLLLSPRLRKLLLLGTISLLLTNRLEPLLAAVLLT